MFLKRKLVNMSETSVKYLLSLIGYLIINTIIFIILSIIMGNPLTFSNFLITTGIAIVFHKFFVFKKSK